MGFNSAFKGLNDLPNPQINSTN